MAVAPFIGRCESEECDRDDPKILIWKPVKPGNNYARCHSCGEIRYVWRTRDGTAGNPYVNRESEAVSEGDE